MSMLEMIIGGIIALLGAAATAFGIGYSKAKSTAESVAANEKAAASVAAAKAAADRQTTVTKEAAHVDQTVSNLSNDDVDNQLRNKWRR